MRRSLARGLAGPVAGGAVTAAALGPLHGPAEALLSIHMVQHLLLVGVAAPLFALGRPELVLAHLPRAARAWLPGLARGVRHVRSTPCATAAAVAIWVLHTGVLWAWHVPALYELALRRPSVHMVEHASMLGAASAFWTVVRHGGGPRGALGLGGVLLYLFAAAGQCTVLGALLTLAGEPWYASHAAPAAARGITPLEDQQLAGAVMWIAGGLVYVAAALAAVWMTLRSERVDGEIRSSPAPGRRARSRRSSPGSARPAGAPGRTSPPDRW